MTQKRGGRNLWGFFFKTNPSSHAYIVIFQGDSLSPCSIPSRISKVAFYSIAVLVLMLLFNIAAKVSAI